MTTGPRLVIVFVVDGLRPDSITREDTPTLFRLRAEGVRFASSHAVFPTVTRVNAAAFSTGAQPAANGLLGNQLYVPAVDRARALAALVENKRANPDEDLKLYLKQLHTAERRTQLIVRALTCFYLAVGSFAASALISLFGAAFFIAHLDALRTACMAAALICGLFGVGGLVCGSTILVFESRMTLRILLYESEIRERRGIANAGGTTV